MLNAMAHVAFVGLGSSLFASMDVAAYTSTSRASPRDNSRNIPREV